MAEVKVSALTALTGANVANGDELYIVDTGSPNVSKKITADELAQMPQLSSRYAPVNGAWTAYTPTLTSGSGSFTSATVSGWSYLKNGSFFIAEGFITITTAGTAAGAIVVTLPSGINWTGYAGTFWLGGWYEGNGGTGGMCLSNGTDKVSLVNDSGTTAISDGRSFRPQFSGQVA